jgi:hypothetical protein
MIPAVVAAVLLAAAALVPAAVAAHRRRAPGPVPTREAVAAARARQARERRAP